MLPFNKIYSGIDISGAKKELERNSHLFGELGARKRAGPVHNQMDDIWLRYGDVSAMIASGDYSGIANEHDSV